MVPDPDLDRPGVYVEEIPGARPPVAAAQTSVAAFVGPARRGPLDSPVEIGGFSQFTDVFGGRWRRSELAYAVQAFFANGGARAVVVRVAHPHATAATLHVDGLRLIASSPGRWGDQITATVMHAEVGTAAAFTLEVTLDAETETFADLSVDEPSRLEQVLAASALVCLDGSVPTDRPAAGTYAVVRADRGSHGSAVVDDDYIGPGLAEASRGLFALDAAEDVNLICLPPPRRGGDLPAAVWPAAAAYARARGAILLLDPPADADASTMVSWAAGLGVDDDAASHVAAYFPRLRQPRADGRELLLAPSGAVAGVYARTDVDHGVWKAPAGLEASLIGATGVARDLSPSELDLLVRGGVNPLRDLPGNGPVVWGARTLAGADSGPAADPEWRHLPARRLALHIERSLARGLTWAVFEPSDEPLWAELRAAADTFLLGLFRQGAFAGESPKNAYFVRCGRDTMTQADLDSGRIRLLAGFAATRPAEFTVVSIELSSARSQP